MQPILVNNFCNGSPLQISAVDVLGKSVIALTQFSEPFDVTFQHAMTVEQAKGMAKQILELAYSLEAAA